MSQRTTQQQALYEQMCAFYDSVELDASELIRRLKYALHIENDTDLSDLLGFKNRGQVNMFRRRNRLSGEGFLRIILLLSRKEYDYVDFNKLINGLVQPINAQQGKREKINGEV